MKGVGREMGRWMVVVVLAVATGGCAVGSVETGDALGSSSDELRPSCDAVRCAIPLCAPGQHLAYQGRCCPTCVGPSEHTDRCATVLCAAVACPDGQQLVTSPGDCCGHCVPTPPVAECDTDDDCPQIYCIRCPCPVSECRGRQCVTTTPDESTCGGAI